MGCHGPKLIRRKAAADLAHLAQRVVVAPAHAPGVELRFEIGGGLPGERRIARPHAFAVVAVAGRARLKPARRVAALVEGGAGRVGRAGGRGGDRQGGIIGRNLAPVAAVQPRGDSAHRAMVAPPARIIVELAVEIAGVEPGEPRRLPSVALAREAVAGEAGGARTAIATAEGDRLARRAKGAFVRRGAATGDRREAEEKGEPHGRGTNPKQGWFPLRNRRGGAAGGRWICPVQGEGPESR
ncbi:MAG TPA: hypothetical protein PKD99_05055 [Sphingopyxis sp.]|nr:hypothetical protein [Sphingopyxis sp.]HMP44454.1 hypothetical protein [Sphingopyxis sp.]HMQ19530.1 hypothetical protein [Sphingopyxis sp.]